MQSTRSGIKPARSSPSAVVVHAAAARPAVYTVCQQPAVGIRLKLCSYNLFTFNPSYNYFNFLLFS